MYVNVCVYVRICVMRLLLCACGACSASVCVMCVGPSRCYLKGPCTAKARYGGDGDAMARTVGTGTRHESAGKALVI